MRVVSARPSERTTKALAASIGSTFVAAITVVAVQNPVPVVAALLLISAAVAVIRFPVVALVVLLFVEPFHFAIFTALANRAHLDTGPFFYWKDVLVVALFVRAVVERLVLDRRPPARDVGDRLLLFYILAFVGIAIVSPSRTTVGPALGRYVEGPLLFLAIRFLRPSRKELGWCIGALLAATAVMGAAAIYEQFFARYSFHRWYGAHVGDSGAPFQIGASGYRSGSFLLDPLIFGFYMAGAASLAVAVSVVRSR